MPVYAWKKNIISSAIENGATIHGKLIFKTKVADWASSREPVVIPVSIHSVFHEGLLGRLKMQTFLSTIKNHVNGKVTILMGEGAHRHVLSLKYQNDYQKTYKECLNKANEIVGRFKNDFEGCDLFFWNEYIIQDKYYQGFHDKVWNLYQTDPIFQALILSEAEATYTPERVLEYPDKMSFLNMAVKDSIGMCIANKVLSEKGYKYFFYPGTLPFSMSYVKNHFKFDLSVICVDLKTKEING